MSPESVKNKISEYNAKTDILLIVLRYWSYQETHNKLNEIAEELKKLRVNIESQVYEIESSKKKPSDTIRQVSLKIHLKEIKKILQKIEDNIKGSENNGDQPVSTFSCVCNQNSLKRDQDSPVNILMES